MFVRSISPKMFRIGYIFEGGVFSIKISYHLLIDDSLLCGFKIYNRLKGNRGTPRDLPWQSHSRLPSPRRFAYTRLATLLALGGFTSQKTILNRFLLVTRAFGARVQIFPSWFFQQKRTPIGVLFVALNVIKGVWTEVKTNKRSTIILVLGLIKIDM